MSSGLYSLATIIKRLEAATSRIEDIALTQGGLIIPPKSNDDLREEQGSPSVYSGSPGRPSTAEVQTATPQHTSQALPPPLTPPSVIAFDTSVIEGRVKPFVGLTKEFAAESVKEIVALVEKQYNDLRELLNLSAFCAKPDQKTIESLLTVLQGDIEAISRKKEASRKEREWFTHITLVGEGAPSVGWVVSPKPGSYMADIKDSLDYYGNKLIKEFKDKDPKHVEWARAFISIVEETRKYVIAHHPTGLAWNPSGITVEAYKAGNGATKPTGGPPPPPPPPPPTVAAATPAVAASGPAAVFAALNRGEEVTKGLRKVDKSEMTHKNPELRASSVVPAKTGGSAASTPKKPLRPSKPQALAGKKPAKFALEGNKWTIEYQENEQGLTVEDVDIKQSVNLYSCKNTVVIIKGKVNAVTLVNCVKTSVLVESVVSAIAVTSSPSFTLQVTGFAPMIQLDSTDSGQVYLSKESLNVEIVTAKCSAINISLPVEGEEDGVFEEQPVPEMLRTVIKDGKLVTTVVEHVG